MDGITVLSLFDGMSCGRLALDRAGIKVNNYFASEIDKYAIQVAKHNYPNIQHIGDVTKVKVKSLCLSEVYSYICNYDSNLQSNISEWEVLYWLNKDFTFSAKIGTQKPNERQKVSESSIIQRIEEIWFSNREMGSIRKFGYYTRSGSNGEENYIRISQQLQCSKWGYDNDIYRRYKEENIGITIRQTKNGDSEKKNFGNIEETVFKGKESKNSFGENEKSDVEERCSGKLLERKGEDRFSRKVKEEKRNGRKKESGSIDEVIRELCRWDETDGIAQNYWNILRLHKEEQITVVEYVGGFYIFKGKIDLCIGGSPCQGFSFAGKQLNFDDPRSKLFFEFVRLLKECSPKYFLLENVKMKKEYQDIITEHLGVEPIEICSSLFSAQQRKRLYWTNINVDLSKLPKSNNVIADVLDLPIKNKRENKILMSKSDFKVKVRKNYIDKKELALFLRSYKTKTINEIAVFCNAPKTMVEHWFRTDNSFSIPDAEYWFKLKECLKIEDCKYDKAVTEFELKNNSFDMAKRIYHIDGKHPTLTTLTGGGQRKTITDGKEMFYLNPEHCEKLQTVPLGYTKTASERQRFRMLGNGWTVDVIAHIFGGLS